MAGKDKAFELNLLEFGVILTVWNQWKELHPIRPEQDISKALDFRIREHAEGAYRKKVRE